MGTPVTPWRSRAALARSGLRSQTATSVVFSIWDRTRTWVCPTVLVPITAHRHCLAIERTPDGSERIEVGEVSDAGHGAEARRPGSGKARRMQNRAGNATGVMGAQEQ